MTLYRAILSLAACVALAEPLPPPVRAVFESWLLRDCSIGEQAKLEAELRKIGPQLEEPFIDAAQSGPGAKLLLQIGQTAQREYVRRQELLKTGKGAGLSAENLALARKVTESEYVARQTTNFITGYKARALHGLGVVATEHGRNVLESYAKQEGSPLQSTAVQALKLLSPPAPAK
jgi:hypothetical protein